MSGNSVSVVGAGSFGQGAGYQIGDGFVLTAAHVAYEWRRDFPPTFSLNGINVVSDYKGFAAAFTQFANTTYGPGSGFTGTIPNNRTIEGQPSIWPSDSVLISQGGNVNSGDDGLVVFLDPNDMLDGNLLSALPSSSTTVRRDSRYAANSNSTDYVANGRITSITTGVLGTLRYSTTSNSGDSGGAYLIRFENRDFVLGTHSGNVGSSGTAAGVYFSKVEWDLLNTLIQRGANDVTRSEPLNLIVGRSLADANAIGSYRADLILGRGGNDLINDGDTITDVIWANDQLFGGDGADSILAGRGFDLIHGGDHRAYGGSARTSLETDGVDTVDYAHFGASGTNIGIRLTFGQNSDSDVTFQSAFGTNTDFQNAVFVRELRPGATPGATPTIGDADTLISIEKIIGTAASDQIVFSSLDQRKLALVDGQGGIAEIDLAGNPTGVALGDLVDFSLSTESINFNLDTGRLELASDTTKFLVIKNAERVFAGAGADVITGNAAANFINGGGGADQFRGIGGGDDLTIDGADTLIEAFGTSLAGRKSRFGDQSGVSSVKLFVDQVNNLLFSYDAASKLLRVKQGVSTNFSDSDSVIIRNFEPGRAGIVLDGEAGAAQDPVVAPNQCFPAGTLILMADGSRRAIEKIRVGDLVFAFDPSESGGRGDLYARPVTATNSVEKNELVDVNNGLLRATPGHRVLTADGSFALLGDLGVGDVLVNENGENIVINSVRLENKSVVVYNFTVDGLHTYIAEKMRVHNDSFITFRDALGVTQISISSSTGAVSVITIGNDGVFVTRTTFSSSEFVELEGRLRARGETLDSELLNAELTRIASLPESQREAALLALLHDNHGIPGLSVRAEIETIRRRDNEDILAIENAGDIGRSFGSQLTNIIGLQNPFADFGLEVLLTTLGENLFEVVRAGGVEFELRLGEFKPLQNLPFELLANVNAAIDSRQGVISSYLSSQLVVALGIEGLAGRFVEGLADVTVNVLIDAIQEFIDVGVRPVLDTEVFSVLNYTPAQIAEYGLLTPEEQEARKNQVRAEYADELRSQRINAFKNELRATAENILVSELESQIDALLDDAGLGAQARNFAGLIVNPLIGFAIDRLLDQIRDDTDGNGNQLLQEIDGPDGKKIVVRPEGLVGLFKAEARQLATSYISDFIIDGIGLDGTSVGERFGAELTRQIVSNVIGGLPVIGDGDLFVDGKLKLGVLFENVPQIGATLALSFLVDELGIEGFGKALFTQIGGQALGTIANNLTKIIGGEQVGLFSGIGKSLNFGSILSLAGSFLTSKLVSNLVQNSAGALGAQIGGLIGSLIPGLGQVLGPVFQVLGALIGNLFGTTPRAGADLLFNEATGEFVVGASYRRGKGDRQLAIDIATQAGDTLNAFLGATGGKILNASEITPGHYGVYKDKFTYRERGRRDTADNSFTDINDLVSFGVLNALEETKIGGGDVYIKRALYTALDAQKNPGGPRVVGAEDSAFAKSGNDLTLILADLATAADYSRYLADPAVINALILAAPESAFAIGWAITFQRAKELGLHRRHASDWYGGWNQFLFDQGALPSSLTFELDPLSGEREFGFTDAAGATRIVGDTVDTAGKDRVLGTAGSDSIIISNRTITVAGLSAGTLVNGAALSADLALDVAAVIDAGAGNDTVVGGDAGNDILGGDGSDVLSGGKLDDWIFGGSGNDRLFAGAAATGFAAGDAAAEAAAIAVDAGNGDLLDGGDGDDVLYGGAGSDFLIGGAGVDRLLGGAGGDILDGGAGDDQGAGGAAGVLGGAGSDQYLFGFGSGRDVLFDESDPAGAVGASGDSIANRVAAIAAGTTLRGWAGGGAFEVDGSVRGGDDAVVLGAGVTLRNLKIARSGTVAVPGFDLVISLVDNAGVETGDQLVIKDWFESTRRVEWLRFADGLEFRIGDITSFIVGTGGADVIIGSQGADFIYAGDGDDRVFALAGDDFVYGGAGGDFISGDDDDDLVLGGVGDDRLVGGRGNDVVSGDDGDDEIQGGDGRDLLSGGLGDDTIVGGVGADIAKFSRGDKRDTIFDRYVDNFELVWQAGSYQNGYVLDVDGQVTKNGVAYFSGGEWIGQYEYDAATQTLRRFLGPVAGVIAADGPSTEKDVIEFGVGIDIQDLLLRRVGNDLEAAISTENAVAAFDDVADRITLKDWFATGPSIETLVFAATGAHELEALSTVGSAGVAGLATDGADTITGSAGADWLTGNLGDDTINGGDGVDILVGGAGSDSLLGGLGADILYGGFGDDTIDGGAAADNLFGGDGVDIASYASNGTTAIVANLSFASLSSGNAIGDSYSSIEGLEGGNGGDRLTADAGDNTLKGNNGADILTGGAGADTYDVSLSGGNDIIREGAFASYEIRSTTGALNTSAFTATWTLHDVVAGQYQYHLVVTHTATGTEVYSSVRGVDFLYTTAQSNFPATASWPTRTSTSPIDRWINGAYTTGNSKQAGVNLLNASDGGQDSIDFGVDISLSTLTVTRQNGVDLKVATSTSHSVLIEGHYAVNGLGERHRAVEALTFDDGLTVNLLNPILAGEAATTGDDFFIGDANANTFDGGLGNDVLSGGAGNDVLSGGDGDDTLEGGAGNDRLDGGTDSVSLGGAKGGDWARYTGSTQAVNVNLTSNIATGGHAANDILISIENLLGSKYNDTLIGGVGANILSGLNGNDTIEGRDGDDALIGGEGADTLRGGAGNDDLSGQLGIDILDGGDGDDILAGGDDNDSLSGGLGIDVLNGQAGDDALSGGDGADVLSGEAGVDTINGDVGDDQLSGGEGADILRGGDGADALSGDGGSDLLEGGAGDDAYFFTTGSGADRIVDASGVNRIAITGASREGLWLTRSGANLVIQRIGTNDAVTVENYFTSAPGASINRIEIDGYTLFLKHAGPLIDAMTALGNPPAELSAAIVSLLETHWTVGDKAAPSVVSQSLTTNENEPISGAVSATDFDDNIVSYALAVAPSFGALTLDTVSGAWTYTPDTYAFGIETFSIVVTDADGQIVSQTVTIDVLPVNSPPSAPIIAPYIEAIPERNRPILGDPLSAITIGGLEATDPDPATGPDGLLSFEISDARFEVATVDGLPVLRLKAGVQFDFETQTSVIIDVRTVDGGGLASAWTPVTIAIGDAIDYYYGAAGADSIAGLDSVDWIEGGAGNDTLNGLGGDDTILGQDGNDIVNGGDGADAISGGLGDDTLAGEAGADVIDGGDGDDAIGGGAEADQILGGIGNDTATGGADNDAIDGGAGNDTVEGGDGDDVLNGGDGDDILTGGAGADRVNGGAGVDTLSFAAASASVGVSIAGGVGTAGDAFGDVYEDAFEVIVGSAFGDTITGGAEGNRIEGGDGDDTIFGGAGNDVLIGGAGNDYINAEAGDDMLDGGVDADVLIGGVDNDTYLIGWDSGADTIYNYGLDAAEIDVIGYRDIEREQLWFSRAGDDLVVSVVGSTTSTRIQNWFTEVTGAERLNYKIDFFLAGEHVSRTVDAEGLVNLMAGQTQPTTQAAFNALIASASFGNSWRSYWGLNAPPSIVTTVSDQSISEDGVFTQTITLSDDITPLAGLTFTATAVNPVDLTTPDTSIVSAPSVVANSDGTRTISVAARPNASGVVGLRLAVTDAGGLTVERTFRLTVNPIPDAPTGIASIAATETTLDFDGALNLNLTPLSFADQDGSESHYVEIRNLSAGLTLNKGTFNAGVWTVNRSDFAGLAILGPTSFATDQSLSITANARENATGAVASDNRTLSVPINARPTNILPDSVLFLDENVGADTPIATLTHVDPDGAGDAPVWSLSNTAGGRFSIDRGTGVLRWQSAALNYEAGAQNFTITAVVTDSLGLARPEDFTVHLRDVNEAPTGVSLADVRARNIDENTSTAARIHLTNINVIDDALGSETISLAGADAASFEVVGNGLYLRAGVGLNYEAKTSYAVTVNINDPTVGGAIDASASYTLAVNNLNDNAPVITTTSLGPVSENAPGGGVVSIGTVAATDADGPSALRYQLVGGNAAAFSIDSVSGIVSVQTNNFNYEAATSTSIDVRVWDGGAIGAGNGSNIQSITIAIQDGDDLLAQRGVDNRFSDLSSEAVSQGYSKSTSSFTEFGITDNFTYIRNRFGALIGTFTTIRLGSTGNVIVSSAPWESVAPGHITSGASIYGLFRLIGTAFPVVLDLDGDGVEITPANDTRVTFDLDSDGLRQRTDWVGADDSLLVLDRNLDGAITSGAEISFVNDLPGARTDLEGLAAYDTSGNGLLDAADHRFAEFRVWRDANQNGVSESGELLTLAQAGVVSLNLEGTPTGIQVGDLAPAIILNTTTFQRADGTVGEAADAVFRFATTEIEDDFPVQPETSFPDEFFEPNEDLSNQDDGRIVRPADGSSPRPQGLESAPISALAEGASEGASNLGDASPTRLDPDLARVDSDNRRGRPALDELGDTERSRGALATNQSSIAQNENANLQASDAGKRPARGEEALQAELIAIAASRRSAFGRSLSFADRQTLQMTEALASFSPRGGAAIDADIARSAVAHRGLVTSMPDLRPNVR